MPCGRSEDEEDPEHERGQRAHDDAGRRLVAASDDVDLAASGQPVKARLDVEEHPHQEQADQRRGDLGHVQQERVGDRSHRGEA